jgi:alpha-beta hydrolase superfamily lysophospholipase
MSLFAQSWQRLQSARGQGAAAYARFERQMRRERKLTPQDIGLGYEPLMLQTDDGLMLSGWWIPAPKPSGWAACIQHHYGGQKFTALGWAELLGELGVDCLVFDARGHAGSDKPDGKAAAFGQRYRDVLAASAEIRRRGADRLLIVGQSQGAAVALKAAGRLADADAVICDSGPSASLWWATWGLAGNIVQGSAVARAYVHGHIWLSGSAAGYSRDLFSSLAKLRKTPLLWLHGDQDRVIDPRSAALWFRSYAPLSEGRWRSALFEGEGHLVSPQKARAEVATFLGSALRRPTS